MCCSFRTWSWYFMIVFLLYLYLVFGQQAGAPDGGGAQPSDEDCVCLMENTITCESDACHDYLNLDNLTVVKLDEITTKVNGPLVFLKGMEDPTKVYVVVEKCDGGHCKVAMTHEISNFCNEIDNEDSPYHSQLMNIDFPKCPIPPGIIFLNDVELDTSNIPVNSNNRGRYKATIKFRDEQSQDLAAIRFGFEIDCD